MHRRTAVKGLLCCVVIGAICAAGMSARVFREWHFHGSAEYGERSSAHPRGLTDLNIGGEKVSTIPLRFVVYAGGVHTSSTRVPITAMGVEAELELRVGGTTYKDRDSDDGLNCSSVTAYTSVQSGRVGIGDFQNAYVSASSVHDFYDASLGGWITLYSSASGSPS